MASWNNFSQKARDIIDSDYNDNPQLKEGKRKTNKNMKSRLEKAYPIWLILCSYFRWYPDVFLDFIQPDDAKKRLYFYQRIYLRVMLRYRKVFITATRGTSKSFLLNLAFVLLCIFYPGTNLFVTARGKEQAAKITQGCLDDIFNFYPLLRNEVRSYIQSKDYTKLIFYNNSKYDVVQMSEAARGQRKFGKRPLPTYIEICSVN